MRNNGVELWEDLFRVGVKMEKRLFLFGMIVGVLFFSIGVGAEKFSVIEFKSLPDDIITNIPAFPVTIITPSTTSEVFVNGQNVVTRYIFDFFAVVDLNEGINNITVRVIDKNGSEVTYTKQIEYDPDYSTEESELIYANPDYEIIPGVIVIDVERGYFLGIIKNQRIKGITRNGSEIILQNGERYSTKTHSYTGISLPDYYGTSLLFSHDGNYVYYKNYKVNLSSNSIEGNLPEYVYMADISQDDKKIVTPYGYIYTENNTFVELYYRNGSLAYMGDFVIDPTGKYVIHSSYEHANGKLTILYAEDASIVTESYRFDCLDYAGDIVFSPDGKKLYAVYAGNPSYGCGGIQIIDMDTFKCDSIFWLNGARSLAVSKDGKIYTASGSGGVTVSGPRRGIIEMVPKLFYNRTKLEIKKVYLVKPYKYQNSIFYKSGICRGDVNGDNVVDIFDLAGVGLCYGQSASGDCQKADLTGDGKVDIFDLATVGLNYGRSC